MNNESLMKDLRSLECVLDILVGSDVRQKWFISFGSLLYVLRDKKLGIEFNQDIDISIIGRHNYEYMRSRLLEDHWDLVKEIRNDVTNEILCADFRSPNGLSVDLFFWIEVNGYLWHTYDYMNEKPSNGIPTQYHFKPVPKWMMNGDPYPYRWFEEISPLKVPNKYGTLLDYWYPHWFIPDNEFGVSKCLKIVEPRTCENLEGVLKI